MRLAWLWALLFVTAACRTSIKVTPLVAPKTVYVGDRSCDVYDYPAASDVPEGSKNLGWVQVPRQSTDDETFLLLRQKICEMGGDALSQPGWINEGGSYEPNFLKANAWSRP